ncbi:hypothetical protein [Georgenia muralis]
MADSVPADPPALEGDGAAEPLTGDGAPDKGTIASVGGSTWEKEDAATGAVETADSDTEKSDTAKKDDRDADRTDDDREDEDPRAGVAVSDRGDLEGDERGDDRKKDDREVREDEPKTDELDDDRKKDDRDDRDDEPRPDVRASDDRDTERSSGDDRDGQVAGRTTVAVAPLTVDRPHRHTGASAPVGSPEAQQASTATFDRRSDGLAPEVAAAPLHDSVPTESAASSTRATGPVPHARPLTDPHSPGDGVRTGPPTPFAVPPTSDTEASSSGGNASQSQRGSGSSDADAARVLAQAQAELTWAYAVAQRSVPTDVFEEIPVSPA